MIFFRKLFFIFLTLTLTLNSYASNKKEPIKYWQINSDSPASILFGYKENLIYYNEWNTNNKTSYLKVFDLKTKKTISSIKANYSDTFITPFAINSNFLYIAMITKKTDKYSEIQILNAKNYEIIKRVPINTENTIKVLKFDKYTKYLAIGLSDYKIKILDLKNNKITDINTDKEVRLNNGITDIEFSNDNKYLAESGDDDKIYIHDLAKNKIIKSIEGYAPLIFKDKVLSYNSYQGIKTVNLNSKEIDTVASIGNNFFAYSKDNTYVAYNKDVSEKEKIVYKIILYNLKNKTTKFIKTDYKSPINFISFSHNNKFIAISNFYEKSIQIWEIK